MLFPFNFIQSQGPIYDTDAQAFFNRVMAVSGTLSATEKTATNQLVIDLKANSLWTPMKAIYPMVGASAAACAQNLKSSSFTGVFNGGWTFASTGVTPNGSSAYMDTNLNNNTSLNLNDVHVSVYLRTNTNGAFCDLGNFDGSTSISLFARYDNKQYTRINDFLLFASDNTVATTDSRGFRLGNRSSSSAKSIYINNSRTDITQNSVGKANQNILIGARNNGPAFYSNRENAFASIGDGLTDTQASNFYTAIQSFQTTLSRNV